MKFYALGPDGQPTGFVYQMDALETGVLWTLCAEQGVSREPGPYTVTYVLDDDEGLALLRAVGGAALVQEYLEEQRALEYWESDGGWCG